MGDTSTDVTQFDGEYGRAFMTEIGGVRMRVTMMRIHTVAARRNLLRETATIV